MKWSYIPTKASILALAMMISAQAQPDTVVLNSTEFRFPETHPGRVFVVKKVVVNGQQSLKKGVEAGNPASPALGTPASATSGGPTRDVMGRVLKSGEYAKRMARIGKSHQLPTAIHRGIPGGSVARQGLVAEGARNPDVRYRKSQGARYTLISNSPLINTPQDIARLEKEEREAVREKYGALSDELIRKQKEGKVPDSLEVFVQLKRENPGFIDGAKVSHEARKANAQAWARSKSRIDPRAFAQRNGLKAEDASPKGSFKTKVSRAKLLDLARDENIVSIAEARAPTVNAKNRGHGVHYQSLLNAAYNPPRAMTHYGNLNVATFEGGITHRYVNNIDSWLQPVYYDTTHNNGSGAHAEGMFHLLSLGTEGNNRYHLNPGYGASIIQNAFSSIVGNDIEIISTSWGSAGWETEASYDAQTVDHFAYIYPYPIVVFSAGNLGHSYGVQNRSYTSLVAGNVQHYDDATYTVDFKEAQNNVETVVPSSQSTNPPAKYGWADDWELPSLVAPGFTPDPWFGVYDSSLISNPASGTVWHTRGGTSLSAPVLAAMATNVRAAFGNSGHPAAPLETKAALLVTAENVDGNEASQWYDERDGFGTVSGANAVIFAENAVAATVGGAAYVDGIASGTLDSLDFVSNASRTYNFKVPSTFPTGKHLRIVLTWTSSPGVLFQENELSDLALEATTDNWTWYASRENGNIETFNFEQPTNSFTPNGEYQVTIHPWIYRTSWDGPRHLHYTLAWTWVKSHAD